MRKSPAIALLVSLSSCVPSLPERGSFVEGPRVLGVRSEPGEALPGDTIRLRALVVEPERTLPEALLEWAVCTRRRSLSELGPVDPGCVALRNEGLEVAGAGVTIEAAVPRDACERFGPNPPPSAGEGPGRPVDPDTTGGYYQPFRWLLAEGGRGQYGLAQVRVRCGLGGATQAQSAEYTRRARPNENPAIEALEVSPSATGPWVALPASASEVPSEAAEIPRGVGLYVRVRWPACSGEGAPCGGAERYPRLDLVSRELVTATEQLRASWFAPAGAFDDERSGPTEQSPTAAQTRWRAPGDVASGTTVPLWVVLRDDRGGAAWASARIRLQ